MEETKKTLGQLFVPICLETLFFMLAGMVDTLMLSSVSDQAVGAVGTSNTYISIFLIMFSVISMGMMAVMTQNIGANRPGVAWQARRLGIVFNSVVGVILSVVLFFFSGKILAVMGIAASLRGDAESYLRIVGGTCLLPALIPIFSGYLRSFGYAKQSLFATVIANLLNIALNALFLFGMDMGVAGVAIATALSRLVNLIIIIAESQLLVHAKEDDSRINDREIFGQIIRVGLPSAMETALYQVAIILVVRFMNQMDADGMNVTARSYAIQITNRDSAVSEFAEVHQRAYFRTGVLTGFRLHRELEEEYERQSRDRIPDAMKQYGLSAGVSERKEETASLLEQYFAARIDTALEEELRKNERYQNAREKSRRRVHNIDRIGLDQEQWETVDQALSAGNRLGAEYGRVAYILGFQDAMDVVVEIQGVSRCAYAVGAKA